MKLSKEKIKTMEVIELYEILFPNFNQVYLEYKFFIKSLCNK